MNTTTTKENEMTNPTCNICSATGDGAIFPMLPKSEGFTFGTICVGCDTGSNDRYEGWVNNSTWRANLWLSNDQRLYTEALKHTALGIDNDWAKERIGQRLVQNIMYEMQRLLGRGETAMYFDFCPEDGELRIPQIDRHELGESWVANVLDHRAHGEVI